jgi:hypothetical protein
MAVWKACAIILCALLVVEAAKPTKLQIGVKKRVENCTVKSKHGDTLSMHYTVRCQLSVIKSHFLHKLPLGAPVIPNSDVISWI